MIEDERSQLNPPPSSASPWRRIAACLVDYFSFMLPLVGFIVLGAWLLKSINISPFSGNVWMNQLVVILVLTLPVILYLALCEASRFQATVGKRLLRISVADTSGERANLKQTTIRAIVKLLPWEYFHTIMWHWEGWPTNPTPPSTFQIIILSLGWLAIGSFVAGLFVGSRRTPYDWVAGTVVTFNTKARQQ